MKASHVSFALLVLAMYTSVSYGISDFCQTHMDMTTVTPAGTNFTAPELPTIPEAFTTNIEMNINETSKTVDVMEYFDNIENRAAVLSYSNGVQTQVIFDYMNDQVLYVTPDNACKVSELTSGYESDLFGYQSSDGNMHILTSDVALKFGQQYGETYLGKDVIRGIAVNHWKSCLYWERMNATFTVDYYFSDPDAWSTSSTLKTVPVRADVRGVTNNPDGSVQTFRHVYDYFAFKPIVMDGPFETPPNIICKGRKRTKPVPSLPKQFYYRQEIILPGDGIMTAADVWYDQNYRLIRFDYRPLAPAPPTYTINPITQVDDFNSGIRYIKDKILGNCSISPIQNSSFGSYENQTYRKQNGSYVLQIKNPLQLFYLNKNFTFVGQRDCRGLICDVFSAVVQNFAVEGVTRPINTTIEVSFLSSDMVDYPNKGSSIVTQQPVKVTISASQAAFYREYNILDFDKDPPSLSKFDISSCYAELAKLHFNVRFPGIFKQDTADIFKLSARLKIAALTNISPLRVQDVTVDYDLGDIFISATLLDRSPAVAEFTFIPGKEIERHDDLVISNVQLPAQCADLCVDNSNFTCNSFDFCPNDANGRCRLSKSHIGDGTAKLIQSQCEHYSRTVNGPRIPETTVLQAYSVLRVAVYNQKFEFRIQQDNSQDVTFVAVDTSITFGMVTPVQMPVLPRQFSYTQEVVIPSIAQVSTSKVWYDADYHLVRYDFHISSPSPPFYSTNPMTVIHDFNTGVAYTIDKFYENCTISAIDYKSFDANIDLGERNIGGYVVQMRNPLHLFNIDNNYRFIGQKTIRGLLCNGYEGLISNFTLPGLQGSNTALLRYFFLEKGWTEVGEDTGDLTYVVPVRFEITSIQHGYFIAYNFIDFEERHPDLSLFDIRKCFSEKDKHHFQIQFPGQFHPYLNIYEKIFQLKAQMLMAGATSASVIRFQGTKVDYDDSSVYITSTLLGRPPFLSEFTLTGKVMPHHSDGAVTNITSVKDCANLCLSISSFPCDSFDFCPSAGYCFLDKTHVQDGAKISNLSICNHYSKSVNATAVSSPDLMTVYLNLKNVVYKGMFSISVPLTGSQLKNYTASSIRDDIIRPPSNQQPGRVLEHFTRYRDVVLVGNNDKQINGVAVDDCAVSCDFEELFDCQSFEYFYNSGTCILSKIHPEENPNAVKQKVSGCDLYSREYIDRYTELPGTTFATTAATTLTTQTANICAKRCTLNDLCKSFDYCDNIKSCRLLMNHTLNVPSSVLTPTPECSHYSRDYIDDFKKLSTTTMSIGASLEFKDVSVDQCAKLCVEEESVHCSSFTFCGNVTLCSLRSVRVRQAPAGTVIYSGSCDLYTRIFYPGHPPQPGHTPGNRPNFHPGTYSPVNQTQVKNVTQYKTSAGALVGVAFGVLIPGIVLGAAMVYFFRKYKAKQHDDMGMNIVNREEEES